MGEIRNLPMQVKTEEFFLQSLRASSAGSTRNLPPSRLSRIRAFLARHLWHYYFIFDFWFRA